jgi:hypothetical protein
MEKFLAILEKLIVLVHVLVVGGADNEARAHALDAGPEHLARKIGVVIHHQNVGGPVA